MAAEDRKEEGSLNRMDSDARMLFGDMPPHAQKTLTPTKRGKSPGRQTPKKK